MEDNIELTLEELTGVVGGYENQPDGSDTYPYDREGKCSKCKVISWWSSKQKMISCPRCGGSWEYVHTGQF